MRLLLMSHGNMAQETLRSAELILGKIEQATAIGLQPEEGPDELFADAEKALAGIKPDESAVVLVDLLGGTPSNVVVRLLAAHPNLKIASGLNLPMLIDFVNQQLMGKTFDKAQLLTAARNGVMDVNQALADSADADGDED
uniref:PTS system, mannose-specific IIB component / PTS system, mannose-specific IIA component n=1 Tax=Loigolactobacillus rennini TaxID=238013 RepID=A0A1K2I8V5_9LACO|nr:PTS system, mannose-specific IIB component / PTS system, mannose-specific IIA component [Loigolactobacillus rennini]